MILKRIGPLSLAKIMGILYAAIGLIVGFIVSAISLIATIVGSAMDSSMGALPGMIFGMGAIFLFPLFYGGLGFLSGLLISGLYNLVTRFTGGLELEFEDKAPPTTNSI